MNADKSDPQGPANKVNEDLYYEDDEDFMEMLQMQEECRMEMMKYYIQAQNPELFEEVYYGVSYEPDQVAAQKQEELEFDPAAQMQNLKLENEPQQEQTSTFSTTTIQPEFESLVSAIKTNLNKEAPEFIPKRYQ